MSNYINNMVKERTLSELVELYNGVADTSRKKFSDKKDALKSLLKVSDMLVPAEEKPVKQPTGKRTVIADRRADMVKDLRAASLPISYFIDKHSVSYKSVCTDLHAIRKQYNLTRHCFNGRFMVYTIED